MLQIFFCTLFLMSFVMLFEHQLLCKVCYLPCNLFNMGRLLYVHFLVSVLFGVSWELLFLYFDAARRSRGTLRGSSGLHEINLHRQHGLVHFPIEGPLRFHLR